MKTTYVRSRRTSQAPRGLRHTGDEALSVQERLERSPSGRAAIGAVILFTVGSMVVSNLPTESGVSKTLSPTVRPFLNTTGLSQHWWLFAPSPRTHTQWLEADLTYRDGVTIRWHQPRSDRFVGQYRAHRWQKWAFETIRTERMWPSAATWIGRRNQRNGEWPVRVVLVKKAHETAGFQREGPIRWREDVLYVATFTPDGPVQRLDAP